jgi:hypothetical protein
VRVTRLLSLIRDTTYLPKESILRASARTMTSYGPANGRACSTPSTSAAALATCPAWPTSVWMRTYAVIISHDFLTSSDLPDAGVALVDFSGSARSTTRIQTAITATAAV